MAQAKPNIWLVGDLEQREFAESIALLRATANVCAGPPESIVLAESRPGTMGRREIERLRRNAPLAGVVSLCGTWCEGETRTGRPVAGTTRLYWYEFASWWTRQLELLAVGKCPEWARRDEFNFPATAGGPYGDCATIAGGRVAIATEQWETYAAIADVLRSRRCDAAWIRPRDLAANLGSVNCGIWEGGQLSDAELVRLAEFTERMSNAGASVVALLDFPRTDRCELARGVGVAEILGKPWHIADLVAVLERLFDAKQIAKLVA